MSNTFKYQTHFNFVLRTEHEVYEGVGLQPDSVGPAEAYLSEDDMTQYVDDPLRSKLERVEWQLEDADGGVIVVEANQELTQDELSELSEWIGGQCSDGLGEGFEQQRFAEFWEYVDDAGEEDCIGMISFDWKSNKYKLSAV